MGIDGLLGTLKPVLESKHISELSGSTVAIDAMSWLYRGCYACSYEICKKIPTNMYLRFPYQMIEMLRRNNIKPIVVVDGLSVMAKDRTHKLRAANKERAKELGDKYMQEGNEVEARKQYSRCIKIRKEFIYNLIDLMRSIGVDYLIAPYESDSQIAHLCRQGLVDYAITEDSDLLCYNVPKVIFKLGITGDFQLLDLQGLREKRKNKEKLGDVFLNQLFSLSEENFTYTCILAGCDYLPSIKGMGLKTAVSLFDSFVRIDALLRNLPSRKAFKGKVPEKYAELLIDVSKAFRHQLVFDIVNKKLVPLNSDIEPDQLEKLRYYIGNQIENIQEFVRGDLDIRTLQPRVRQTINPNDLFSTKNGLNGAKSQNTDDYNRTNSIIKRSIRDSRLSQPAPSVSERKDNRISSSTAIDLNDFDALALLEDMQESPKNSTSGFENVYGERRESAAKPKINIKHSGSLTKDEIVSDPKLRAAYEDQANLLQLICEEYSRSAHDSFMLGVPKPEDQEKVKEETVKRSPLKALGESLPFTLKDTENDSFLDSFQKLKPSRVTSTTKPVQDKPPEETNQQLSNIKTLVNDWTSPVKTDNNTDNKKRNFSQFSESSRENKGFMMGSENKEKMSSNWKEVCSEDKPELKLKKAKITTDKKEKQQMSISTFFKKTQ